MTTPTNYVEENTIVVRVELAKRFRQPFESAVQDVLSADTVPALNSAISYLDGFLWALRLADELSQEDYDNVCGATSQIAADIRTSITNPTPTTTH